jgi:hypothetical protein
MKKYVYLDAEYNKTNEAKMNVLCFALVTDAVQEKYWFPEDKEAFTKEIEGYISEGYIFVAYNVESESSALISLDIEPIRMKWIDLYLEYVMLSNHNNAISKGEQYIDGKIKMLKSYEFEKGRKNLAAALFKLCGIKIDSEHKDKMRDLIISCPESFTDQEKQDIMDYCLSDTIHLPKLLKGINQQYNKFIPPEHRKTLLSEILWRGEYAVRTSMMVRHGYPVSVEWLRNLTDNIPILMHDCMEDINSQFPDTQPFKWDKKDLKYKMDTKAVRSWISKCPHSNKWELTPTKMYSLSADAWKKFYNYSHDYPVGNFGAQMLRYFNLSQQLRGFSEASGKDSKTFWQYLGSDGMVRPYLNPYGAQSSRTQPSSTSFLFLKTGWMRSLCVPPKGYAMGAIDYSSQEFLLSALCSQDPKMIQAYADGDVYLYYAKGIGLVPPHGTKETHGKERDLCKATVLGLSYMMSEIGLSLDLSEKLGRNVSTEEAKELVDAFYNLFSRFSEWRKNSIEEYSIRKYVRLPDGFYMFGDNPNFRSVGNMPLQGLGACIMRKAVQLAQDAGLQVTHTLHDALYIMFKSDDLGAMDTLRKCMFEAFCFYFTGASKEKAKLIRMDGKVWSQDYEDGEIITKENFVLEKQKIFVDKRAKKQYSQFSKFFKTNLNLELL